MEIFDEKYWMEKSIDKRLDYQLKRENLKGYIHKNGYLELTFYGGLYDKPKIILYEAENFDLEIIKQFKDQKNSSMGIKAGSKDIFHMSRWDEGIFDVLEQNIKFKRIEFVDVPATIEEVRNIALMYIDMYKSCLEGKGNLSSRSDKVQRFIESERLSLDERQALYKKAKDKSALQEVEKQFAALNEIESRLGYYSYLSADKKSLGIA